MKTKNSNNVLSTHFMQVQNEFVDEKKLLFTNFKNVFDVKENVKSEYADVLENFNKETIFIDNRYEVKLPFKVNNAPLGDNYTTCKGRLKNLTQKTFQGNPELFQEYNDIICKQLTEGIIEKCDQYEYGETHYLPHRPVFREEKESTKVRIVFDASCPSTKNGSSLNDVLMRFRTYNYVVTADIEKAFLQVGLSPNHRNYVRFLWFKEVNNINFENFDLNEIEEYRFSRVLFGVNSSPFLLQATLAKHISEHESETNFKEKILNGLYVDDLTSGADSILDAKQFYDKAKQCLSDGGFNLRKFKSNSEQLDKLIYQDYPNDKMFSGDQKILGLSWKRNEDEIYFNFYDMKSKFSTLPTKRTILQSMATIFDPSGIVSPITVKFKKFYQEVCNLNVKWDDPLPELFCSKWNIILSEFDEVNCLLLDRQYCFNDVLNPVESVQIHIFSDASKYMYAACVYLRFLLKSGEVKTALVFSKHKIVSSKNLQSKKKYCALRGTQWFIISYRTWKVCESVFEFSLFY